MSKFDPSIVTPRKRRGWLKKLSIVTTGFLLLLVIAWFVVTSEAFFTRVILPQAGKAMNAELTAESASISPFSQVTLRGLTLRTTGSTPLLTINEIRAQYSLMAMLGGTIKVEELLIDSPVVHVTVLEDGTSNLDALSQGKPGEQPSTSTSPFSLPQVDLKQFNLKNAALHYSRNHAGGTRDTVEIKAFNVTLSDVKNGASGRLEFALEASASLNPPEAAQQGTAQLKHDGTYTFALGPDLFPTQITGSDRTEVTAATGALAGLAGFGADLAIDMTPTHLKRVGLAFRDRTTPLGELLLSGPFDALKREGSLTLVQNGIDGKLLNRLGALSGLNFGSPALTFTNTIAISTGGTAIKVLGRLAAADLQISSAGQPGPMLQAGANYNLTLNTKPDGALQAAGTLALDPMISRDGTNELRIPEMTVHFDVTQQGQVIALNPLRLSLPPTHRATNEITLTGRVDATSPQAITGALKLSSAALDLTELYASLTSTPPPTAGPATSTQPAGEAGEPEAVSLPLSNFVCEVNLGHLYLRDIDVSKIDIRTELDGGRVSVKPLQCALNGAPVSGSLELNLGVPGFEYEFNLDAPALPLAPVVDSFVPSSKGQLAGAVSAAAHLKGTGVTGPSLQKNLGGQFDLVATNLNLSLNNVRTPAIKSLINVVVAIPDAIRNPGAALGSLLGGLTGTKGESSGWVDELMRSPLDGIEAHGAIGGGRIELSNTYVASRAFLAETSGSLEIASVLSNSVMQFPFKISLSKSLSDKAGLTPLDTPTNAIYVALPHFVTMRGTLGLPSPDVNKLVLAQLALKSGAGMGKNIGGAAGETVGGVLGAVGNLIGAKSATQTNAPATTNTPTTSPASDLIKGIGGLFGGRKQPTTNEPAQK